MCFGLSKRTDSTQEPNRPHDKSKDLRPIVMVPRSLSNRATDLAQRDSSILSNQATPLAQRDEKIESKSVTNPPIRAFSFDPITQKVAVPREGTTFEDLAKRGVIPKSALRLSGGILS